MRRPPEIMVRWLPLVVLTTLLSGMVYGAAQQILRQTADDPQIQMAEDTASALAAGARPELLLPSRKVSIEKSLAPFLIIYDEKGEPLAASGELYGRVPTIPKGVFVHARQQGHNRVTWQPKAGVRSALSIEHYVGQSSGFAVAGRSLREVEKRTTQIGGIVFVGWALTSVATLAVIALVHAMQQSSLPRL